jgi:hypothetical protein
MVCLTFFLKRNKVVALFGIGGEHTDDILHYEVDIINISGKKSMVKGKQLQIMKILAKIGAVFY